MNVRCKIRDVYETSHTADVTEGARPSLMIGVSPFKESPGSPAERRPDKEGQ